MRKSSGGIFNELDHPKDARQCAQTLQTEQALTVVVRLTPSAKRTAWLSNRGTELAAQAAYCSGARCALWTILSQSKWIWPSAIKKSWTFNVLSKALCMQMGPRTHEMNVTLVSKFPGEVVEMVPYPVNRWRRFFEVYLSGRRSFLTKPE